MLWLPMHPVYFKKKEKILIKCGKNFTNSTFSYKGKAMVRHPPLHQSNQGSIHGCSADCKGIGVGGVCQVII